MIQEWDIRLHGDICNSCNNEFEDNQTYYSTLIIEENKYKRLDFCTECMHKAKSLHAYSFWKSIYKKPPPPKPDPLQKETAESLLRRLMSTENEYSNLNVIYILALMLERKRILIEKEVKRSNNETIRIYEHKPSGDTFIIKEPHLRLDQLETVQQQVLDILGKKEQNNNKPDEEQNNKIK